MLTLRKHLFSGFCPFGVVCCLPFANTCSLGSPRLVLSVAYPSQTPVLWVLPVWCCLLLTLHKHLFSGFSPFGVVCCLPFTNTCSLGSPRLVLSVAYPSQTPVLWVLPVWCCLLLTLNKHLFSGFSPFGVVCCLPFASTCSLGSPRLVLSVAYPSQTPVLWVLLVWCCLLLTLHKHLFSGFSPFGVVCYLPFTSTCSLGSPRLVLSVTYPSQASVLWVLLDWCCLLLTLRKHLFSGFSSFGVVCCLPFANTCSLGSPRLVLSVAYPSQAPVLWVLPVWCCLLLTLHKHLFSGFSSFGVVCYLPFASICSLGSPRLVLSVAYP